MTSFVTEQLKAMRLVGMLDAWMEQRNSPTYHDLSFEDRFTLLLEREHLHRSQMRLQRRLRQAQLSTTAHLSDIDFTVPRGLSKTKFLELAGGKWVQDHLNLIIVGATGVGKTFLSSVLADQFCTLGHSVRYFKCADLLMELKFAKVDGSFRRLQQQIAAFELLILDDWLRDAVSPDQARGRLWRSEAPYWTYSMCVTERLRVCSPLNCL
ncbi:ATP-binding protein [Leptolyngbya sp. AN03gr2]|uniref:ATP-binding protein n=1 Tax=Leptolyngbya sp. AN03gr2 TaxID=3423364 RepID=UPI003D311A3E